MVIHGTVAGQQTYNDHDGQSQAHYFVARNGGKLDSAARNPRRDAVNSSPRCGHFKRSRQKYDYIKVYPKGRLEDVSRYMSYEPDAPKLKLKVYTNAPVGSLVEIQLGRRKSLVAYPDGTHSQFQAFTKVSGAWEELEFTFSQVPEGSVTRSSEIDQVTLLFMPGTGATYEFYFDDLSGPQVLTAGSARAGRRR
jgi:hypothetical protein